MHPQCNAVQMGCWEVELARKEQLVQIKETWNDVRYIENILQTVFKKKLPLEKNVLAFKAIYTELIKQHFSQGQQLLTSQEGIVAKAYLLLDAKKNKGMAVATN